MVIHEVAKMVAQWPGQLMVIDCIVSNRHLLLQNMNLQQHGTFVGFYWIQMGTWLIVIQSVLMMEHSQQWLAPCACNMGPMLVWQSFEKCRVYIRSGSIGMVFSNGTKKAQFCHKGVQLFRWAWHTIAMGCCQGCNRNSPVPSFKGNWLS